MRVDGDERVIAESVTFEDPQYVSIPESELPQAAFLATRPEVKRRQCHSHGFTNVGTDEKADWREPYTTIETFEDGSRLQRYYRAGTLADVTFFYSQAAVEPLGGRAAPPPAPADVDEHL